jgi:methanethiol S-methyltransferase
MRGLGAMDNATDAGYGLWWLAGLMIVIASWLLYRYVAPKGWGEWGRAGLVQAFVIALYADMYGFPLTIYVLTTVLGVQIPWLHVSGHLWATLLGFGEVGAVVEMVVGYAFVFLGIFLRSRDGVTCTTRAATGAWPLGASMV